MKILAIESSCDETSAAVVENGTKIISNIIASSRDLQEKYGGIVPELAAREQLRYMLPIIKEALETQDERSDQANPANEAIKRHIDAIAITIGPGLIGSLLVGVEAAKTIAFVFNKPVIPVNHVLAHMYANFLGNQKKIIFPAISLVVSGGHTELYLLKSPKNLKWLGGTLDDAAGECFDKTARILGFGSGGGLAIQNAAKKSADISLPRPMLHDDSLNFSFSGLKTAVMREWAKNQDQAGFAYEIQEAITDVLREKTLRAKEMYRAKSILLSGGVASNLRLREKFLTKLRSNELTKFFVPSPALCTDNAAYIAAYAFFRGIPTTWEEITAAPDLSVEV